MFSGLLKITTLTLIASAAASSVQIDVTKAVENCERKAQNGDTVSVHYTGKLADGTVFDSSVSRGVPISFELGSGRVIQGWEQGILGMCVGEQRILNIPSELGYGERGIGPIPANADLIFDVELVGAQGAEKDEL